MTRLFERIITGHKRLFVIALGLTLFFSVALVRFRVDDGLNALTDVHSAAFQQYQTYLERFGSDRLIFVALTPRASLDTSQALIPLSAAVTALRRLPDIVDIQSVLDIRSVTRRSGDWVPLPLVSWNDDELLLDMDLLAMLRRNWPLTNQLLSSDGRIYGLLIQLAPLDLQQSKTNLILEQIKEVLREAFKFPDMELHLTGIPVFMEAVARNNVTNALLFLAGAGAVGVLIEWYIFKNLMVSLIIYIISAISVIWGIGLTALLGITLNPISGMAFGMILILTTITVTHVVTHYYDQLQVLGDRTAALYRAAAVVGPPGLVCAATTAIGFAGIMISPVATIRQFGLIMTIGAVFSFMAVYLLLPFILLHFGRTTPAPRHLCRRNDDLLALGYQSLGTQVATRPGFWVLMGVCAFLVLMAGIPRLKVNTQFLGLFHDRSPEVMDYRWIGEHLGAPEMIQVVITPDPRKALNTQTLRDIRALERRLLALPGVQSGHSVFRVLETVYAAVFDQNDAETALYSNTFLFQQIYRRVLSDPAAQALLKGCLDLKSKSLCLSLGVADLSPADLEVLLVQIEAAASEHLSGMGTHWITGSLVVAYAHSKQLIRAQIYSLAIVLVLISALLMVQFRSWKIGALSLIPNLFPLAALFGVMGWSGMPLDNVTIMVAVISIGLSVDDTIHYFSQLNSWVGILDVPRAVMQAYRLSAKALISTSAVMLLSFLTLIGSPFKPTASFGWLASVAVFAALLADIVFMPALLLWSDRLQHMLTTVVSGREGSPAPQGRMP